MTLNKMIFTQINPNTYRIKNPYDYKYSIDHIEHQELFRRIDPNLREYDDFMNEETIIIMRKNPTTGIYEKSKPIKPTIPKEEVSLEEIMARA